MQIIKAVFTLLIVSVILISCGENEKKSESPLTEIPEKTETQAQELKTNETTNTPVQMQTQTTPKTSTGNTVTQVTPAGINPPHGQPGHDCSIPVGQPLDGSKLNMTNSSTPQQPTFQQSGPRVSNVPNNSTQRTTTAPGMNPPHGQPGHICSIPVGSPLPE